MVTWKFVEESMFPLTVADCQRAGLDATRWAFSGRALMLVEGTARVPLMRFDTPSDADRFMQGMRFVAARLIAADVHPRDAVSTEPSAAQDGK